MDPALIVEASLEALTGIMSIIQKLRAAGALTDDQIAAAAVAQIGGNDTHIKAYLASLPAAP